MSAIHLHLALNHVPVLGSLFLLLLLAVGLVMRSEDVKRLSLWAFVVLAAGSIAIKFTGDEALEQTMDADWMNDSLVETHEQAADQATTGAFVLGIVAAVMCWRGRKRSLPLWPYLVLLLLAAVTFAMMARTAYHGGQIRHTEIRAPSR